MNVRLTILLVCFSFACRGQSTDKYIDTLLVNVGNRDYLSANEFMRDLADRIKNRVQLTTDGLKAYLEAVEDAFGGNILLQPQNKHGANTKYQRAAAYPKIGVIQ